MELVHSLLIATILLGLTNGQSDLADNFKTKKYCGGHLAQALSAICKGNYNSLFKKQEMYQKKSYWDPQYPSSVMPQETQTYPFQSRSQATSVMSNRRRRRRQIHGVYNECCEKSCSQEELAAYCAAPSKRRR